MSISLRAAVYRWLMRKRVLQKLACEASGYGCYMAEVGVYRGKSARWIKHAVPAGYLVGFDSNGLPEPGGLDRHKQGQFAGCYRREFPGNELIRGRFPVSVRDDPWLGSRGWSLVHIDVDLYESTRDAIEWFLPRMVPGGVMVCDDYGAPNCPGAKRACLESGLPWVVLPTEQAIYRKPLNEEGE